ncbi:PLP-dependent aminotransferase family protein [Aquabacterium sp.]|uniref:MocR-like pyridoxine biosynthesis transcription factor PdxR n=1 Tax=Aquabacterium sp. TaxID=1872578 RepID=UPI002CEC3273|nr:PLP-dependent aminotransferase family protein [Aquabacterium sp.]HSW04908.1 PLP-dependent aminotransferase family protein [Aquabacterium sp.]
MDFALLLSGGSGPSTGMPQSQQHRLYTCLRTAILSGRLAAGTRLPSSRTLARELAVARNSVLHAYERLDTEGFVAATRQGTVVAHARIAEAAGAAPELGMTPGKTPHPARRIATPPDAGTGADDLLPFRTGMPALREFALAPWRRCMNRAWRQVGAGQLGYAALGGHAGLRSAIAEHVRVSRGVLCEAEQVLITAGSQSALDLCAQLLASPGDSVWLEDPGYQGAHAAFAAAGLRLVPIGVDAHGLALPAPDSRAARPRLIYVTPSHQYPLGAVMSLTRRLALIERARALGAWIIEDDYDSEFRHPGPPLPAVQGLSADAPVIYLGTFSKTLFPGLRLGFMVLPPALVQVLQQADGGLALHGRVAEQMATADFITSGHFARHLRRMRMLYAERGDALRTALGRHLHGVLTASAGAGGMHLSVRLDVPVADVAVARAARASGLALRPLSPLCLRQSERHRYNGFVLGYGGMPAAQMDALVSRLGEVIAG